jgi:hypothetical protein
VTSAPQAGPRQDATGMDVGLQVDIAWGQPTEDEATAVAHALQALSARRRAGQRHATTAACCLGPARAARYVPAQAWAPPPARWRPPEGRCDKCRQVDSP